MNLQNYNFFRYVTLLSFFFKAYATDLITDILINP